MLGEFFGDEVSYTRLLLMFPHQGTAESLFPKNRAVVGYNVIFVAKDGSYALVAVQKSIYDYPSVFRYDLQHDGKVTLVQGPIDGVWDWYADDTGVVRMGAGWKSKKLRIHYRPDANSKFSLIAKIKEGESDRFWDVAQIVSGSNKGYVLDEGENGQEEIWVTSRTTENDRMLVWAGNEADPGVLYLYTPATKRLDQVAEYRPKLDFRMLAGPKPVSYTARDGTKIAAYLTLPRGRNPKSLPLIILPHGGPYGVRDKLNYDDMVQLLANRGYAVLQPNYRGSGGYGDKFFELGTGQIGRGMQDDLDDAMDWAVAEGIADPARICVVGGSYGGYAALWSVIRNPERYRCAASWAGVTDWDLMLKYDRRFFTRAGGKKWRARIEGEEEFDLDIVSPYRQAAKLARPLLLAHGTADTNVPFSQYKKFEKAVQAASGQVTKLVIEDEGHSFSKPENEKAWYDALEAFLAKHNPAD